MGLLLGYAAVNAQNYQWAGLLPDAQGSAIIHQVAVNNVDEVVVFGSFEESLTIGTGTDKITHMNTTGNSYFLAKYDASGTLFWSKSFATDNTTFPFENEPGLTIDGSDNIYITAEFSGALDIEGNIYNASNASYFVAKFDTDGNLQMSFDQQNTSTITSRDIAIDASGAILVTGHFFDQVSFGSLPPLVSSGSMDIFLVKYSSTGTPLLATRIGGAQREEAVSLEVTGTDQIYIAGKYRSTLIFIPGVLTLTATSTTEDDIFVAKYTDSFSPVWATAGKGANNDVIRDMDANATGVYITGAFAEDLTFGSTALDVSSGSADDFFIAKLDVADGTEVWASQGGGAFTDRGFGIKASGSLLYATGYHVGTGTFDGTSINAVTNNIFIAKYQESDGSLLDIKSVDSDDNSSLAFDIAVDASDRNYVAGSFQFQIQQGGASWATSAYEDMLVMVTDNNSFNTTDLWGSFYQMLDISASTSDGSGNMYVTGTFEGAIDEYLAGSYVSTGRKDVFIAKFDTNGALEWITGGGSTAEDNVATIHVNSSTNELFITGTFRDAITFGGNNFTGNSTDDVYLIKYDLDGNVVTGLTAVTSSDFLTVHDLATDASGNIFITGGMGSAPTTFGTMVVDNPSSEYYLAKFHNDLTIDWVEHQPATEGLALAVDNEGNIIVSGTYGSETTFETETLTFAGVSDIFIAKYDNSGTFQWVHHGGGTGYDEPADLGTDSSDDIYLTGIFNTAATFDTKSVAGTSDDIFLVKYAQNGVIDWIRSGGGPGQDIAAEMVIDNADYIILTGSFMGSATFECINLSGSDIVDWEGFILKYDSEGFLYSGSSFGYATSCTECTSLDKPIGISKDNADNIYLSGQVVGPISLGAFPLAGIDGYTNDFITKFTLAAGAACPVPEIAVFVGADNTGASIADGQIAAIDFGSTDLGTDLTQVFTIENVGTEDISIASVAVTGTDFSITASPSAVLASGTSANFTVQLSGATAGSFTATVTINNDDSDESLFDFPVAGSISLPCSSPPSANAGADDSICSDSAITLNGTIGGSATLATWSSSGDGIFDDNTLLNANYTPGTTDIATGSVTLTLTTDDPDGSGACVAASDALVLSISETITSDAGADQQICVGETVSLNGSVTGSASGILWTTNGDGTFDNSTALNAVYTPGSGDIANSSVTLTLAGASSGVCTAVEDFIIIGILSGPSATDYNMNADIGIPLNLAVAADNETTSSGSLTASIVTPPVKGTSSLANGVLTYTANENTIGQDVIGYQVDGLCGSDQGTINISILNQPPQITPPSGNIPQGGIVTVSLADAFTDLNGNLDPSTLTIVTPPISGAVASLEGMNLIVNYSNISFRGTDEVVIRICDDEVACSEATIVIEVTPTEIVIYNAISANNDQLNDYWRIDNLIVPNKIKIYNRWGDLVKTLSNYEGNKENDVLNDISQGTYYYEITTEDGSYTGYFRLMK